LIAGVLRQMAREGPPGPRPTFSEVHMVRALLLIGSTGQIGRGLLAQKLGLGEGAARTLLKRLVALRLITVGRQGATLTSRGRRLWQALAKAISTPIPIDAGRLSLDKFNAAILVRQAEKGVRLGIEQRDAAVREGATGASTLIFKGGRFRMPGGTQDCEATYPDQVWSRLREAFPLNEGDVIIVASAGAPRPAEMGCIASALTTLSQMGAVDPEK
jgi:hypothetical protein